jgi:hypothetical protein
MLAPPEPNQIRGQSCRLFGLQDHGYSNILVDVAAFPCGTSQSYTLGRPDAPRVDQTRLVECCCRKHVGDELSR